MKAVKKLTFYFLLVLLSFISCKKPVARMPIIKNTNTGFKISVNWNKALVALQDRAFSEYMKENTDKHYFNSKLGFWYAYLKKNNRAKYTPKPSDNLIYTYQITTINGDVIYSYDDIGDQNYIVDKQQIILGLQKGLKLMHQNERVQFLFPSFLAYGVLGDRKKIKTNQPLIYTVYLKKIIINKINKK